MNFFNAVIKEHLINTIEAYHSVMENACCADEIAKASAYCFECKCALNAIMEMEETEHEEAIKEEKKEHDMAFVTMMLFHEDAE